MFHVTTKKTRGEGTPGAEGATGTPLSIREEPTSMTSQQRDQSTTASAPTEFNAVLGKGSEFEGKLTFQGAVRIDGTFSGQISTSDALVIGEGAKVSAEISCGSVVVHGEVTGNIRAETSVELRSPAKVRGDITTPSLVIERGVLFHGQSKMEALEKAAAKLAPYAASAKQPDNGPGSELRARPSTVAPTS